MIIRNVFWLPFGWRGMAIRPFVFLRKGADHLLDHELYHLKQQRDVGTLRYLWKYATDKEFRFDVEFMAYRWGSKLTYRESVDLASKYL